MNNYQEEELISLEELNFDFDDRDLYELCQRLFNGEITLEEFKEKAHELLENKIQII